MIDGCVRVRGEAGWPASLLKEMGEAGVDRAVLFAESAEVPVCLLAEERDRNPGRFAVVACVDPLSRGAGESCRRLLRESRVAGIELRPAMEGRRWLNVPEVMGLWKKLESLGLPVSLRIASQDYNQFSDVVTSFPSLRIVLGDLGHGPATLLSQYLPVLLEYARYPQVHVGFSRLFAVSGESHPHRDLWPALRQVYRAFGPRRLVWGSGYPEVARCCGYRTEALLPAQLAFVTPADLVLIQESNAARLWFGDSGVSSA